MSLHSSLTSLVSLQTPKPKVIWLGAISFEARCLGSITSIQNEGFEIIRAIAFDYPTKLSPRTQGEQNRAFNRRQLLTLLESRLYIRVIHPYRYAEFVGELDRITSELRVEAEPFHLVVDITCLTKIHTLALAYWLLTREDAPTVSLAYSQPDHYGNPSKNTWGKGKWSTTLLVRLSLDSTQPHSSSSAIVILGHEGDRLRLALNEAEADEGLIIKVLPLDPYSRLLAVSDVQSAWLFKEIQKGYRQNFPALSLSVRDLMGLVGHVASFCVAAKTKNSRVVLCPFGPKTFTFLTAYTCLTVYPDNTWLSYPIPVSYDPEYSEGYKYTLWFDPFSLRYQRTS